MIHYGLTSQLGHGVKYGWLTFSALPQRCVNETNDSIQAEDLQL